MCTPRDSGEATTAGKDLLDNEGENQAQDGQCFSKCEAEHSDWLQDALCFWLTCNAVDVSSEDQTNADSRTNCCQTVTDHIQGAAHAIIPFKIPCFLPVGCEVFLESIKEELLGLSKEEMALVGVGFKRALDVDRGQQRKHERLQNHDQQFEEVHSYRTGDDQNTNTIQCQRFLDDDQVACT